MKKTKIFSIIMLIILFSSLTIGATLYANKQDAIDYFNSMKTQREIDKKSFSTSIEITTNKECNIMYDTEEIVCKICFKANSMENCLNFPETSTYAEDKEQIKTFLRNEFDTLNPAEDVSYTKDYIKGDIINI